MGRGFHYPALNVLGLASHVEFESVELLDVSVERADAANWMLQAVCGSGSAGTDGTAAACSRYKCVYVPTSLIPRARPPWLLDWPDGRMHQRRRRRQWRQRRQPPTMSAAAGRG